MSQTETILLIVLGFALAALIALFVGRFVWALGLRLGARRMQKQVPSTVVSLQSERDRLRAEFAMLSQRLGSKLETAKLRAAEQMAEVTRHRNRIEELRAQLAGSDSNITARESQITAFKEQVAQLESQLEEARALASKLQSDLAARDTEIELRNAEISTLKASASEGSILADPPAPLPLLADISAEERLKARIEELASMSRTMAAETSTQFADSAMLNAPVSAGTEDIERELERLDAEWNRRLSELDEIQDSQRTGSVANVISLANRIRALRKDIAK